MWDSGRCRTEAGAYDAGQKETNSP
jgi:hypothetical protein